MKKEPESGTRWPLRARPHTPPVSSLATQRRKAKTRTPTRRTVARQGESGEGQQRFLPQFSGRDPFPAHSLPVAVQDLREKLDRPQNLKLCRLRLNFKALRRSCLAADLVPEGDVWYTTPRSSPSQRCCLAVSRRPGQRGSVGRRGANDGAKVFQLALPGVAPVARAARQEIL